MRETVSRKNIVFASAADRGDGVFAARAFRRGETAQAVRPAAFVTEATRLSYQVGHGAYIEAEGAAALVSHACAPSTGVRDNDAGGNDLAALADIPAGGEITFDYETTEHGPLLMTECLCGADACRRRLTGFRDRPEEILRTYGQYVAAYLRTGS